MEWLFGFGLISLIWYAVQRIWRYLSPPPPTIVVQHIGTSAGEIPVPLYDNGQADQRTAIDLAEALFNRGRKVEALDLLDRTRTMILVNSDWGISVELVNNAILDYRWREAADAKAPEILAAIDAEGEPALQTALYKHFPENDQDFIRYACWRLEKLGKIARTKKGRTYLISRV